MLCRLPNFLILPVRHWPNLSVPDGLRQPRLVDDLFSQTDAQLQAQVAVVAAKDVPPSVKLRIRNSEGQVVKDFAAELIQEPASQRQEEDDDVVPTKAVKVQNLYGVIMVARETLANND